MNKRNEELDSLLFRPGLDQNTLFEYDIWGSFQGNSSFCWNDTPTGTANFQTQTRS